MRKENTVSELVQEVIKESKKLERKAFKLFAKDALSSRLVEVERAKRGLLREELHMASLTMKKLKDDFEKGMNPNSMGSNKEYWTKIVLDNKSKS